MIQVLDSVGSTLVEWGRQQQQHAPKSMFFLTVVVYVVGWSRKDVLSEMLYADNLISISETIEGLRDMHMKWKDSFKRADMKHNLRKYKVIQKYKLYITKLHPSRIYSLTVKANSVLQMGSSENGDPKIPKRYKS